MHKTTLEDLHLILGDQPGVDQLRRVLTSLLAERHVTVDSVHAERLESQHRRVYRLHFASNGYTAGSFIVKRLEPTVARRNQLLLQRWLPAAGLSEIAPELLGVAADPSGSCVWHVYGDAGDAALCPEEPDLAQLQVAVELIARLHTSFAGHPLLPECRLYGGDLGINFFTTNVCDAIGSLQSIDATQSELSVENIALRDRLLNRLQSLLYEQPRRSEVSADFAGAETLLHGDLWTTNTFVIRTSTGLRGRLIDWDHAGVGPVSYDLSTFLLRFPADQRLQLLEIYREAVAEAGWQMPGEEVLNLLFETAEYGRFANRIIWPAIALVHDRAEWPLQELAEVERWFQDWRPVLPKREPLAVIA